MKRLAIVGAKLQGMEAAYLAKKSGIETVILDKNAEAPAFSLADEAVVIDVTKEPEKANRIFARCDAVLPANENIGTLRSLTRNLGDRAVPLIFDLKAYEISSSKQRTNEMMRTWGIPMPIQWPDCGFPVVVKPSGASGSTGVSKAHNADELERGLERIASMNDEVVVQEYITGPSVSIEVIGDDDNAIPLVTTEIHLDGEYDCKMVSSPWVDPLVEAKLSNISRNMAVNMGLRGIMDVEAIVHKGIPKVLEIDARIPSQTPTAIYHSHGINIVSMLFDLFVEGELRKPSTTWGRAASYEHIAVDDGVMRSCGEGSFAKVIHPRIVTGLFGSDEMITDYGPGKNSWRATIICSGEDTGQVQTKRLRVLRAIMDQEGITKYVDPSPEASL